MQRVVKQFADLERAGVQLRVLWDGDEHAGFAFEVRSSAVEPDQVGRAIAAWLGWNNRDSDRGIRSRRKPGWVGMLVRAKEADFTARWDALCRSRGRARTTLLLTIPHTDSQRAALGAMVRRLPASPRRAAVRLVAPNLGLSVRRVEQLLRKGGPAH